MPLLEDLGSDSLLINLFRHLSQTFCAKGEVSFFFF